jgi:putative DNA methylase
MSGTPISADYIRTEGKAGRIDARLMAIVAEGKRGRVYLSPTSLHEEAATISKPEWIPDVEFFQQALGFRVGNYGMTKWSDLFTARQLVALTTFTGLIDEVIKRVFHDCSTSQLVEDSRLINDGGTGAAAYSQVIGVYLAFAIDRMAMTGNSLVRWNSVGEKAQHCFGRQTLSMLWDFAEPNFFASATGSADAAIFYSSDPLKWMNPPAIGTCCQDDAATQKHSNNRIVSTDPPYYDNVGYADLSEFFYVWLRKSLGPVFPNLFTTVGTPKSQELVATPDRHGSKEKAESFFLGGMTSAMSRLAGQAHPVFPVSIYYAFKQSESDDEDGATASTGWETFLDAVIRAGFATSGTWPMRTEMPSRMRGMDSNALASSIIIVCRPRSADAQTATRREFIAALQRDLPEALRHLQAGNIAPVDLAQAAIGPGMAVFTRYSKVLDAEGKALSVRQALALINETLDTALAEQEGDFDADSRWALAWFEQHGFGEGEFGVAETLSKAKNTSVSGLEEAGILKSGRGKVRLLKPDELPADWSPETDTRLTNWETVHHLIRVLASGGESAASELVAKLGTKAETARELAYRLYTLCERKKRATEALAYNGLVQSWPELIRLAQSTPTPAATTTAQGDLI